MSFPFMDVCDVRQEVFPVRQNHFIGLIANSAWARVHFESLDSRLDDLCEEQPRNDVYRREFRKHRLRKIRFLDFRVGHDVR